MVNLWNPAIYSNGLTPEQQNLLNFDMQSTSNRSPNIIVVPVGQKEEQQQSVPVLPQVTPAVNTAADRTYMPLVPSTPQVDRRALADLSYSEPAIEDLQGPPTGEEPLPKTDDPWYGRIAGTVKNILSMSSDFADKLTEKTPTGTVLSDWVNNFASSPFLAMPRNEVFQRMQAQANANLDRQAKYGNEGSQAAAMQIYRQFLGELGYDNPNLTPEQRGAIEQTAYDKTLEFLQASRSNINIGGEAGPKWMSDINKKRYEDLSSAADNSAMTEAMADELIKGIESGEFVTGGGDLGAAVISAANALGLSSDAQQRYSALFNSFSMERRKNLLSSFKGAISNKEQDIITQAIGSLGSSAQSNLTFLKLAKLSARLARESQEKFDELAGLGLTDSQINTRFNAYLRDRALKTAAEVAQIMGSSSGGVSGGSTGGEGHVLEVVE